MTQYHIIYHKADNTPLNLSLYASRKRADQALDWQERGGFPRSLYGVAITRNGLLWDSVNGDQVTLSRGIFTHEAFEAMLATIALQYRIYCQRGYGWNYSADQLEPELARLESIYKIGSK